MTDGVGQAQLARMQQEYDLEIQGNLGLVYDFFYKCNMASITLFQLSHCCRCKRGKGGSPGEASGHSLAVETTWYTHVCGQMGKSMM